MHLENYKSFYIIKNSYITCLNIIMENNIILILLLFFCYIFHYLLTFFFLLWISFSFVRFESKFFLVINLLRHSGFNYFFLHFSLLFFFFFLFSFFFLHFLFHISFLVDIYNEKYINKRNYLKYKLQYEKTQINFKL